MFHLYRVNRLPLSDWTAQVERRLERALKRPFRLSPGARALVADYYNIGMSIEDTANDLLAD